MNFFAMQRSARRSSLLMTLLFVIALLATIVAVDAVFMLVDYWSYLLSAHGPGTPAFTLDRHKLVIVSLCVLGTVALASLLRILNLREGGSNVARNMGATLVKPDTINQTWRRLCDVVEETAIASGTPVPEIYVMEREDGINAFAAGFSATDAAICITSGCLDKLTRDELQGVIAHEFSHILNGDMRFNIRLMGLLFGMLFIGQAGRNMIFWDWADGASEEEPKQGSPGFMGPTGIFVGYALFAVGSIGFFFGRLMQAAVARSREALADASAVQFTRQRDGIAGALKKIAALSESSYIRAGDRGHVAHMLFGEGAAHASLLSTHPPLLKRIKALDPGFTKWQLRGIAEQWQEPVRAQDAKSPGASIAGLAPAGLTTSPSARAQSNRKTEQALPGRDKIIPIDKGTAAKIAQPGLEHYQMASVLHRQIPDSLKKGARDPEQAPLLVIALAISGTDPSRSSQLAKVADLLNDANYQQVKVFSERLRGIHPLQRMPLAALAFPSMRRLPKQRLKLMVDRLDQVIHADGVVDLNEYCLAGLVRIQLMSRLQPSQPASRGTRSLASCREATTHLFAIVARYGNADSGAAERAFSAACTAVFPESKSPFQPPRDWQPALSGALQRLATVNPTGKEKIIIGLIQAINEDGRITFAEAELLRVICATLECPMPPIVESDELKLVPMYG